MEVQAVQNLLRLFLPTGAEVADIEPALEHVRDRDTVGADEPTEQRLGEERRQDYHVWTRSGSWLDDV
jgi:hypothetical protein